MHRHAGHLPGDVPQGNVDTALYLRVEHPRPGFELVPDGADVEWVAPDEHRPRRAEQLGRDVDTRSAHEHVPVDALVGREGDDVEPHRRHAETGWHRALVGECPNIDDLHATTMLR